MKQAKQFFLVFLLFLFISILILLFSQSTLLRPLQSLVLPLQKMTYSFFNPSVPQDQLAQENSTLRAQLARYQSLELENKALREQFAMSAPMPQKLIPATVIGLQDSKMIIDKGTDEGIRDGAVVVVKDMVLGTVSKTTPHGSVVTLITHPSVSLTGITAKTRAIGIVRATTNGYLFLDNVVLSDTLETRDIVKTKGDINEKGGGFPPDLIVGEITSVKKKESNLFQQAEMHSLVDVGQIRIVFVMK